MKSRSYSIISEPDTSALAGFLDGFLGLPDFSTSPAYLLGYFSGSADYARLSLSI
jgi:hypothetical protein